MTIMKERRRKSRGQSMVEFALVFPMFAVLLFGIVDMSRYVYSANALNEIAREAARQGTVGRRPAECASLSRRVCIQTLARNRLTAVAINLGDVQVVCQRQDSGGNLPASENTDNCGTTWKADDFVHVTITSNLNLVTPLIGQFIGNAPMTGEALVTVAG